MNSMLVLCVGLMGAAPAGETVHQPVQTAQANYGILPGGCYRPAYRPPTAQRAVSYPGSVDSCPTGWCGTTASSAACPYGTCAPGQCVHGQCNANCPTGDCPTHGVYNNRPAEPEYHILPSPYPAAGYPQPRGNPLPRTYPVNWSNTSRPAATTTYGSSSSPFFN